jgi:hypothetical protein
MAKFATALFAAKKILNSGFGCPYRKLNPQVLMVQSTKHRPRFDTPGAVNEPSNRRFSPSTCSATACGTISIRASRYNGAKSVRDHLGLSLDLDDKSAAAGA